MPSSLFDKIWDAHVVAQSPGEPDLLYIDRHLIHEVTSPQAFEALKMAGRKVRRPDLTFGVIDHVIPTDDRSRPLKDEIAEAQLAALEANQKEFGIKTFFGVTDPRQGVIHVCMPEQGIILPGHTVVCGDSHTATHGAMGALAFGIGTSEVEHVFATQTIYQTKPKQMAVKVSGKLTPGVSAKDLILEIIYRLGVAGGTGFAVEYMGEGICALSMEERLTLSNMAIECGARVGLIAPDQTTFDYLRGLPFAPQGDDFKAALAYWQSLKTDSDFKFDQTLTLDAASIAPRVTWGTNPAQSVPIDGAIPSKDDCATPAEELAWEKALKYQGLAPGQKMMDTPIDYVFIGSCTNGRLEDLRDAAAILKGKKVAAGVTVLVVPGSGQVKAAAEAEGLDEIFRSAGCLWRSAGCSMCLGMNPDLLSTGQRCASTSNRNFEGRQGRDSRTHLVSPAVAAASALRGAFSDPRQI